MKNKKLLITSLILLSLILTFTLVSAQSGDSKPWTPKNVELAYPEDGWFCLWTDGVFDGCFSCCFEDGECEDPGPTPTWNPVNPTPTPKNPDPTATPKEPDPTNTPPVPEPSNTPVPEPTDKPMCNCGIGPGAEAEGCDPNPNCNENRNSPTELPGE
jgi:hypothetical protein